MTEGHYFETGLGGGWDAALLEPMAELNAEILAAYAGVEASLSAPWRRLGAAARTRLAACPYLLLDAGFARAELWSCWPRAGVHEATATVPQLHGQTLPGTPVLRRCLLFAWHLARANRLGARIALGMSASCAAALASCRIVDLEALAELRPAWI